MNIIDTLVAELDLDVSKFTEKQRKAVESMRRTADEMKQPQKEMGLGFQDLVDGLGKMQTRLLGIAAIFLGGMGIKEFTRHVMDLTSTMSRLGLVTGTTVGSLSAWGNMGALLGASRAGVQAGVSGLSNTINQLLSNPDSQSTFIQLLGGMRNLKSGQGMISSPRAYLKANGDPDIDKLIDDMHRWATQPGMNRGYASGILQQIPGMNQDLLSVILQNDDKYRKMQETVKKYVPSSEDVASMNKLTADYNEFEAAVTKTGQAVITYFTPFLDKLWKIAIWLAGGTKDLDKINKGEAPANGESASVPEFLHKWWNGEVDWRGNPISKTASSGSAASGPSSSSWGSSVSGGVSGGLAAQRKRISDEVAAKPWLKEKLFGVAMGEDTNPEANLAIMESAMNRAIMTGISFEQAIKLSSEGGYYAGYNPSAAKNPKYRAMLEENYRKALGGSNVARYATDNSSNQPGNDLANRDMASGRFVLARKIGGEYFLRPGERLHDYRTMKKWNDWVSATQAADADWGKGFDSVPFANLRPGALTAAGGVMNSSSSSTTVNSMNIYTQTGDPYNLGIGIKRALENTSDVAASTTGPL